MSDVRGTYYIRSAHGRGTVGQVYDAHSERDALRQYIASLGYESPDLSEGYVWQGRFLVTVENDEVYATTREEK